VVKDNDVTRGSQQIYFFFSLFLWKTYRKEINLGEEMAIGDSDRGVKIASHESEKKSETYVLGVHAYVFT
jgi:hypothetical protein